MSPLPKLYDRLTAGERAALLVEALARSDMSETERLCKTCPRATYTLNDLSFVFLMRRVRWAAVWTGLLVVGELQHLGTRGRLKAVLAEEVSKNGTPCSPDDIDGPVGPLMDKMVKVAALASAKAWWTGFQGFCSTLDGVDARAAMAAFVPPALRFLDLHAEDLLEVTIDEAEARTWQRGLSEL